MLHEIVKGDTALREQEKGRLDVYWLRSNDNDMNAWLDALKGSPGYHGLLFNHINYAIAETKG